MHRIALIFPPVTDPRSPRLALPSLAAFLRRQGIAVSLFDLDIGGLLALLQPENLIRAGRAVRERASPGQAAIISQNRLLALSERLPQTAPQAIATLHSPYRFFESHNLASAREVVLDALDLLSASCTRPVHYGLEPLRYEVDGVDGTRFADLVRITADREANLFADYWEEALSPTLERSSFDLVGVSMTTRFQLIPGLMLARWLRARGHFVVIGGSVLPRFSERLLELPEFFSLFANGVVAGDGETALAEIVSQLASHREFSRVPNYLYCCEGRVRFTHPHLEEVATLPAPDFTGLPLDSYLVPARVLPILVGRGCYYSLCKFCEIPHNNRISSQPYRARPPATVVADILQSADKFECRHFVIGDEAVRPEVMEQIADELIASGRDDLHFEAYARFEKGFTASTCRKLARAGLRRVMLGLESGSQQTLNHMRKGIDIADARPIIQNFLDAGIGYLVSAMVGLPEEAEESARATFNFFAANTDLFSQPWTGFDIRPMELQLCSPYMREAAELGLKVPLELLAGEFALGVGEQWENTRGLTRAEIQRMFEEYGSRLDRSYSHFHTWPSLLWPVWDEWGLLYAGHYRTRPFPYCVALPEDGEDEVGLRWNPAIAVFAEGDSMLISSRRHTLELRRGSYDAFDQVGTGTPEALIARLAGGSPAGQFHIAIRELIALLVRASLLQIVPPPGSGELSDLGWRRGDQSSERRNEQ